MLPTITTLNGIKVRLGIAAKETHCNRTMVISMFKYAYRSKSPGTASKVELHAVPKRDWENQCSYQPDQHSSQLIRNLPKTIALTTLLPNQEKERARNLQRKTHPPLQ